VGHALRHEVDAPRAVAGRSSGGDGTLARPLRPARRPASNGQRVVATRRHGGFVDGPQPLVRATVGITASDRHLSIVAPRGRRATHVAVVMTVALGIAMLGAAAFQTQLAQRQVELDRLDSDIRSSREQYEGLRRERAELRAPERLAGIAAANGMREADGSEFLRIDADVIAIVAASTGDIDPIALGDGVSTLDDFRDVKATTAAIP
jgi:hypothetical protein